MRIEHDRWYVQRGNAPLAQLFRISRCGQRKNEQHTSQDPEAFYGADLLITQGRHAAVLHPMILKVSFTKYYVSRDYLSRKTKNEPLMTFLLFKLPSFWRIVAQCSDNSLGVGASLTNLCFVGAVYLFKFEILVCEDSRWLIDGKGRCAMWHDICHKSVSTNGLGPSWDRLQASPLFLNFNPQCGIFQIHYSNKGTAGNNIARKNDRLLPFIKQHRPSQRIKWPSLAIFQ